MSEKKKRRRWTASEKLRVVVTGLDGSVEISELCRREGINPTQYYLWKKQLMGSAAKVFENGRSSQPSAKEQRLVIPPPSRSWLNLAPTPIMCAGSKPPGG